MITAARPKESLAIFGRLDKGPDHLSPPGAVERLVVVSHVLAGQTEIVQFGQPEVIARKVIIGRVVRVATQAA